ncbi:MAG: Unknown protein [uncultured Sulfurovum sp.]|uniref:Adhesin domain-containing protein n=1 Tax=uncultured Sulfurovum sp. TaxID=269237 RepID=A0A6S6SD34_9BACT|nr:MAG: Unknown protein [uncultured Sulfurovum sp.]
MKKLTIIVASTLLLSVSAIAMTVKVEGTSKKVYEVLEGDTMQIEGKRGLEVDLTYKSEHVDVGETSDVNILLHTKINSGILKVNVKGLDDALVGLEEQNLEFKLSNNNKTFPIDLQLSSAKEGIHYINLTLLVEGQGSRVLAVPVNIGNISAKINNKSVETTPNGVAISVSSAQEDIK